MFKENISGLKTKHIYNKIGEYNYPHYIEKSIYDMKTEHKKSQNKKMSFLDNVNECKIMERFQNKLIESIDEYLGLNIIDDMMVLILINILKYYYHLYFCRNICSPFSLFIISI